MAILPQSSIFCRQEIGDLRDLERMSLALMVMLAMAYGRIKEKQQDKMRSLVGAA